MCAHHKQELVQIQHYMKINTDGIVDVLVSSKEQDERQGALALTTRNGDETDFKEDDLKETGNNGDGTKTTGQKNCSSLRSCVA